MGWTYTHRDSSVSVKDFIKDLFDKDRAEVLDIAIVKMRTAYMAVKDKRNGDVYACVFLLDYRKNDYYNFGYKDMDETCGPCESECPERILKLLTPTTSEWANEWRQRCWDNINRKKAKPKVTDGTKIRFNSPIRFTDGSTLDSFRVVKSGSRVLFSPLGGYGLYRISKWRDRDFEVIQ